MQINNDRRGGVAAAELAVCLPVLILIAFSLIELTSMIFVRQSLAIAAYEGTHRGVKAAATAGDIVEAAESILDQRRVEGAEITVTPNDVPAIEAGELFTVRVTAPSGPNSIALFGLFESRDMQVEVVAMKEFDAE